MTTISLFLPTKVRFWFLFISLSVAAFAQSTTPTPVYRWTTLAGRASIGAEDGLVAAARFNQPHGLAMDSTGNLYVADTGSHTIRKITPSGFVSTLAGTVGASGQVDGTGASVRFKLPQGLAVDATGNVYVADTGNHTIRKITPFGVVTTLGGQAGKAGNADGAAASALFDNPDQIAVDGAGNVYVADNGIRRISAGSVATIFLTSQMTTGGGRLVNIVPTGNLAVDPSGRIFFSAKAWPADNSAYQFPWRVLKRDTTGEISLVMSQDPADPAPALLPYNLPGVGSMAMDAAGNLYFESQYVSTYPDHYLFKVSPGGVVSYGGSFSSFLYSPNVPRSIVYNPITNGIIFTRTSDAAIMHLPATPSTEITVLAGTAWALNGVDGIGSAARFTGLNGITVDQSGKVLIGDANIRGNRFHGNFGSADLRQISPGGTVTTLYASFPADSPAPYPIGVAADQTGNIYFATAYYGHPFIRLAADGTITPYERENSYYAKDMTIDAMGNLLVLDWDHRIHQRNPVGAWSVLAGKNGEPAIQDGSGGSATFGDLLSITVSGTGEIFVLDSMRSSPTNNVVTTCVIRQVRSNGSVSTVSRNLVKSAAAEGSASPDYPTRLAIDRKGVFFLVYFGSHIVTRLNATGEETEIGGKAGIMGSLEGDGDNARFQNPNGIAVDAQDNLYVVDGRGTTVRQGQLAGYLPLISVQPQNQSAPTGSNITLSVIASGTPAPTYQWFFNGSAFNGATASTLSFTNARSTDAGDYTVVVTNPLGSVTSNKATLAVSAAPAPTTTPTPAPTTGGGGSIEAWFALVLLALAATRDRVLSKRLSF
jgi:sugar lactone lactonase YvrE